MGNLIEMPAHGVALDPATHVYTRNGQEYVSVTTILEETGCSGDVRWFKEEHRTRGSRVHHLAAQIFAFEHPSSPEEWDETCDFPEIIPYGQACQRWCREVGFEVLHSEARVWDDGMRAAGTLDTIGILRKLGGITALVDVKSGKVPPSVGPQTAAYEHMARKCLGVTVDKRYSLCLRPDGPEGKFQFRECKDESDYSVFVSLYNGWSWRKAHKLIHADTATAS